jgi:hypothetical protein
MPEVTEPGAGRSRRFLEEQSAAWADLAALLEALREAFLRHLDRPQTGGSFRDEIQSFSEASRELYLDFYAQYKRRRPAQRALVCQEELDTGMGVAMALRRACIDGQMHLLLARASLRLCDPWILYRNLRQQPFQNRDKILSRRGEWAEWVDALDRDRRAAEQLIARYRAWFEKNAAKASKVNLSRRQEEIHQRHLAFWWRRQRAVADSLELEAQLVRMALETLNITAGTLDDLRLEREDLRRALRWQAEYLGAWAGGAYDPPDTDARIVSLEERLDFWQARIDKTLQTFLPEQIEVTEPRSALPSIWNRWRTIEPRSAYWNALRASTRPALAAGLGNAIEQNLAIARDMERANEVILYAQGAGDTGENLLGEALNNAKILLEQCDHATPAEAAGLEDSARASLLAAGREASGVLELGRAGFLALVTRRQGRRVCELSWLFIRKIAARTASCIGLAISRWVEALQIRLGWRLPKRPPLPPVVHRTQLREAMDLEAAARQLPALYRRLFRLSPVQDPRFLVGRDEELLGFQQAFEAWRAGGSAACLLVGARGSGKTSLLNCAMSGLLSGETVVQAQFSDRITESGQMDAYVEGLGGSRRIVILEEIERTFLKTIGGFDAVRRLQELIQSTASSTFWILALNDFAFLLLDQAVGFGASFSHRINAMSVLRGDLVKAILQRHNLSGLRLSFAPPPPGDPRINRMRRFLGIEDDPEEIFFDSLYEQSGGIFRSAFELWQSSIQRVEAGKVLMKQPLVPDFGPLRRGLTQIDHFSLLSIQQHGSLTAEELSLVLLEPASSSRLRLERLAALDLVAPDPDHVGLRVRPEAQLFVNDLLQRLNMI